MMMVTARTGDSLLCYDTTVRAEPGLARMRTLPNPKTKSLTATPMCPHSIVGSAESLRDAVNRFEVFQQEHLAPNNIEFAFVSLDSLDLRVKIAGISSPRRSTSMSRIKFGDSDIPFISQAMSSAFDANLAPDLAHYCLWPTPTITSELCQYLG